MDDDDASQMLNIAGWLPDLGENWLTVTDWEHNG